MPCFERVDDPHLQSRLHTAGAEEQVICASRLNPDQGVVLVRAERSKVSHE